ncbi:hypothetical protein Ddye_012756 [Dipteronia dyeriana]|uniref:Uncharacterized protein n=1 Tax=Dipteronia dyeriana TaxID=168575 RepID=A0AAE0CIZ0_9ROSI|nr:hypothetical protein Ddye_012756 [Dipteronia dyeriana]
MISLLSTLMRIKKEGTSVADYLNKMKSTVDDLALIGNPLSDAEITAHTLNGLADEFKELIVAILVCDSPITFEDLYDKLLDEELTQKRGETKDDDTQIIAQFTQKRNNYKGKGGKGNRGGSNPSHTLDQGFTQVSHLGSVS